MSRRDPGPRGLAIRALLASLLASFAATGQASCASTPDPERTTVMLEPDFPAYKTHVNDYMERRCGTLDCHGQPGRAYRVYSRFGLRVFNPDAGIVSGVQPTTDQEILYNFQSLIGVQPELMRRVVARNGDNPNELLILRKPLNIERHKGGRVMGDRDEGYRCITGWLRTPQGGTLDSLTVDDCAKARTLP